LQSGARHVSVFRCVIGRRPSAESLFERGRHHRRIIGGEPVLGGERCLRPVGATPGDDSPVISSKSRSRGAADSSGGRTGALAALAAPRARVRVGEGDQFSRRGGPFRPARKGRRGTREILAWQVPPVLKVRPVHPDHRVPLVHPGHRVLKATQEILEDDTLPSPATDINPIPASHRIACGCNATTSQDDRGRPQRGSHPRPISAAPGVRLRKGGRRTDRP
jgi:hypothetical protein